MKLIIGNKAYSSWSLRGWLACKQSALPFEEVVVPLYDADWDRRREGAEFAPSSGKVPILWDGEAVVWDSLAIVDYLADKVGRERFWPADEAARAMARSMAAEMHSSFTALRRKHAMNIRQVFPAKRPDDDVLADLAADHGIVGAGARALRRRRRVPVRRVRRGGHHVRAGGDADRHLPAADRALRRRLYRGDGPPSVHAGLDRRRAGRGLGDPAIRAATARDRSRRAGAGAAARGQRHAGARRGVRRAGRGAGRRSASRSTGSSSARRRTGRSRTCSRCARAPDRISPSPAMSTSCRRARAGPARRGRARCAAICSTGAARST